MIGKSNKIPDGIRLQANYVLWLASWYPNRTDSFNGDFIERHAKAVAAFRPVVVMVIMKDESLKKSSFVIEKDSNGNLTVYRGYYGPSRFPLTEKIYSFFRYLTLQKKIFDQVNKGRGLPALVHVHVVFKAGIFARFLKMIYRIPYIITEHWTGYYKNSPNSIYKADFFSRQFAKWVLKGATLLLPVAQRLGETINEFTHIQYQVIPNVVNTDLFFYKPAGIQKPRFIHPSTMSYVKNPEGILRAAIALQREGYDFELLMVGGVKDSLMELAKESGGLNNYLFFKKEIPYTQVATEMQKSTALVLFSRFENLPCVILEALSCGLPVISTDVGGIKEVVNERNGILLESENEEALKNCLKKMIDSYSLFDRSKIARQASATFSCPVIGKQISDTYQQVLNREIKPS